MMLNILMMGRCLLKNGCACVWLYGGRARLGGDSNRLQVLRMQSVRVNV